MITYDSLIPNGQTITLGSEKVVTYPAIVFNCKTDQVGILYVDFSIDNVNWDSTLSYQVAVGINEVHRLTVSKAWYRIRFQNNSGNEQTYFRLQSLVGDFQALSAPLNLKLSQDADAIAVRPSKFSYESALNRIENTTTWNKYGYNNDIDVGTETIWSPGGSFVRLPTAQTLSIVSSDANDTSGGTGAQSIIIYGVNQNYDAIVEVVIMNGVTPVITTNQYFGINRMAIYLAGSSGSNIGNISANGASLQAQIPSGQGSTQHAFFFIQRNHTALMDYLLLNAVKVSGGGGSPVVTIKAIVTSLVSGAKYEVFRHILDTSVENTVQLTPSQPFVVGEKSLIEFIATTDTNNTNLSCRFSLIETKNIF